jgi:hypothetical protein
VWDGANRKNRKVTSGTVTFLLAVEEDVITYRLYGSLRRKYCPYGFYRY